MARTKPTETQQYDAGAITVLKGLDGVRKRPGMYIGSTDERGLMHLIWEVLDNSVDEAAAGHASTVDLYLHADGSFSVHDDGRGIPVDREASTGKSALVVVFTELHAGGKFGGGSYAASGGLHGVGASVVNALSERLVAEVDRHGKTWRLEFTHGVPGKQVKGKWVEDDEPAVAGKVAATKTGTRVQWWPDRRIFDQGAAIDIDLIRERVRQICFLVPGLKIVIHDERAETPVVDRIHSEQGIPDFVEHLSKGEAVTEVISLHGEGTYSETVPVLKDGSMTLEEIERTMTVDVALRWVAGWDTDIRSFVNTITTPKGGTHVTGFERSLGKVLNEALREHKVLRDKDENVTKDDVQEGLVAVVKATIVEPQFEGQTKEILGTAAAQAIVAQVVSDQLRAWFNRKGKKPEGRALMQKVANAAKARLAARVQRETIRRKNAIETSTLPAKLADCRTHDLSRSELFLIEGDSAAGTCFTGDTLVATVAGYPVSFAELASDWENGVTHFGYALDTSHNMVIVPLEQPRLTRRDVSVVTVTLDTDEQVTCTPDHLFRLVDGSYRRADELAVGTSLAPLYRKTAGGRDQRGPGCDMVWQSGHSQWEHTHRLSGAASAGTCPAGDCPAEYGSSDQFHGDVDSLAEAVSLANHRVACVVVQSELADVYDLSVPGYENFALEAGVFVHNCKGARDSEFQALLPLRGKVLNAAKANAKQVYENAECAAIFTTLGAGAGRNFDIEAVRYGRVILMMDADVDGAHIRALLLTLFYHYCRPMLETGRVFAAMPPLFLIKVSGGREDHYAYTDGERDAILAKLDKQGKKVKEIQRYKGLGEMDAEQLAVTTVDPSTRSLRRISLDDAAKAAQMFDVCMGDAVEPRRLFIVENSDLVDREALDV